MRSFFILVLIIFVSIFALYSQTDFTEIEKYSSIKDNFFPNDEGDKNEKKLIDYIENFVKYNKLNFTKKKIEGDNYITNSYNIEILINSSVKTDEEIIIITPLNSPIIEQEYQDNSLTIKTTLNLIKFCKEQKFNKNIVFLFSGANSREKDIEFPGLKSYLDNKANFSKSIVLVLDILSNKEKVKFTGSINRKPIPLIFLKDFLDINDKNFYFDNKELILSKLGLIKINDYATFLLNKNINTIAFSNRERSQYNKYVYDPQYEENLLKYFSKWIILLDKKEYPLPIDYNYLFYSFSGINFLLPEYLEITIFLIIIFLILLLRNILPHFQRVKISLMVKILPFFLLLFAIFYLLSFIPYAIFIPINKITKVQSPFLNIPILYFFCIFFIPQMIIFILFELLTKLPFPKHNYLYIYGAMIFSYLNLFLFAIVDISSSYIYLWVILMITLSNFTGKNFPLKFLFYFIAAIPIFTLFISISTYADISLIKKTFYNPIYQHFLFSLVIFPITLLLIRVRIIVKSKFKFITYDKTIFLFMLSFILLATIAVFIIASLKITQEEADIKAKLISRNSINEITFTGNINMNNIKVIEGNYKKITTIRNSTNCTIKVDNIQKEYLINKNIIGNRDYSNYQFKIMSKNRIEYIKIFLTCPIGLYPLETNYSFYKEENFTYDYDKSNQEVFSFTIPRNIINDFDFNITLISGFKYNLFIQIEYPFINSDFIKIENNDGFIYKTTQYLEVFNL